MQQGELVSLLGPNGAGKSTTSSVICGLLRPAAGDARILGRSVLKEPLLARRELGIVPQELAHYMEEAEELSDRVAILDHGKLIAQGTRAQLVAQIGEKTRLKFVVPEGQAEVVQAWEQLEGVEGVSLNDDSVVVLVEDPDAVLPRAFDAVAKIGARVSHVSIEPPDLEAVFLHLTGRGLRD